MIQVLHIFSTFAVGGPQRRFAQLAKGLNLYQHKICAMDGHYEAQSLFASPLEECRLEIQKTSSISLTNIKRLRDLIKRQAPDILCTYNWGAMEAVLAAKTVDMFGDGCAHIHFEDGFGPEESVDHQISRRVITRRLALSGKSHIVVPSISLRNLACSTWHLPQHHVHYIPNGIDISHFTPKRHAHNNIVVGTVCALRKEKNLARLLSVFAQMPASMSLLITGDGPEMKPLREQALQSGIADRVEFTGHLEDPRSAYERMDIFALTSDTEQMPLGVLEAMASALPIVATNVGDVAVMVAHENALHCHALGKDKALVASLELLANEMSLRQRLGSANRQKAETEFSEKRMIAQYETLFRSLIADRKQAQA